MKTISTPKNKIWVLVEPHKNIRPFIKCNQRIKKVLPNQLLISVSKIIMMQTNGIDKNYIEIQCLGFADKYYLDISDTKCNVCLIIS